MKYQPTDEKTNTFKVGTQYADEVLNQMDELWTNKKEKEDLRPEGFTASIFLDSAQYLYMNDYFTRQALHELLDTVLDCMDHNQEKE